MCLFHLFYPLLQVNVLLKNKVVLRLEFLLPPDPLGDCLELNPVLVQHQLAHVDHLLCWYLLRWPFWESLPVFHQLGQFGPEFVVFHAQGQALSLLTWPLVSSVTLCLFVWSSLHHIPLHHIQFILQLPILLLKLPNQQILLLRILTELLHLHQLYVLLVKLNLLVRLQLLFFQLLHNPLHFVVLHWHQFEFLLVKLHFGQQFVVFLLLNLLVLVFVLILAFHPVVFFHQLFVTLLELLILLVNVLDLWQFLLCFG